MYESARTPMKPRDIRRRAYALTRQCWLTLIIASVLMCLPGWISNAVEAHGEKLAAQAFIAYMETFLAETEPPTPEAVSALNASLTATLAGEVSPEWTDEVRYAGRYEDALWLAQLHAEDAYDEAYKPWEGLAVFIDLLGLMFHCFIAVRLSKGLLNALHGGECTPHCLHFGWTRTSTTLWLAIQIGLRVWFWSLLPLLFNISLNFFFGIHSDTASSLLMLLVAIWARLHYALAEVHLADDPYDSSTASDCLRLAVDDANAFTLRAMCGVLWPAAIPFLITITVEVLPLFVPMPGMLEHFIDALCGLLITIFLTSCYVCIYDEIRHRIRAAEEAVPSNEGLARARALASQTRD